MDDFRRALLEAVGLLALGDSVRKAIYRHLEDRFSIRRDEIPGRLEEFAEGLRSMLGASADVLLKVTAKRLYAKLGLSFEEKPGWSFEDYVEEAKRNVEGV